MNILTMLWKNLWGGSRTMLFPARPEVSEHYRGLVRFDPELCTGCAICKMRCTAKAIEFKTGKGEFYLELRSRPMHLLRALRGRLQVSRASPGVCLPADLPGPRRVEKILYRCPQADRQAGRCGSTGRRRASGKPRRWRHAMISLETIQKKLGISVSFVEQGGVQWLAMDATNVRGLAQAMNEIRARFITITAYQLPKDEGFRLEYHWDLEGRLLGFSMQLAGKSIDSIYDLCEAVDWIEREIHEEYGIDFTGREYEPLLLRQGVTPGVNLRDVVGATKENI